MLNNLLTWLFFYFHETVGIFSSYGGRWWDSKTGHMLSFILSLPSVMYVIWPMEVSLNRGEIPVQIKRSRPVSFPNKPWSSWTNVKMSFKVLTHGQERVGHLNSLHAANLSSISSNMYDPQSTAKNYPWAQSQAFTLRTAPNQNNKR